MFFDRSFRWIENLCRRTGIHLCGNLERIKTQCPDVRDRWLDEISVDSDMTRSITHDRSLGRRNLEACPVCSSLFLNEKRTRNSVEQRRKRAAWFNLKIKAICFARCLTFDDFWWRWSSEQVRARRHVQRELVETSPVERRSTKCRCLFQRTSTNHRETNVVAFHFFS